MAVTLIGKGHIYGFATFAFTGFTPTLAGWITPKFETLSLTSSADFLEERSQIGEVDALVIQQLGVQCSFRFKPRGSTVAAAVTSAYLPSAGATVTISGLQTITFAGMTNVFNSSDWIYDGTGSIEGAHDGIWIGNITLRRYPGITSPVAIT